MNLSFLCHEQPCGGQTFQIFRKVVVTVCCVRPAGPVCGRQASLPVLYKEVHLNSLAPIPVRGKQRGKAVGGH